MDNQFNQDNMVNNQMNQNNVMQNNPINPQPTTNFAPVNTAPNSNGGGNKGLVIVIIILLLIILAGGIYFVVQKKNNNVSEEITEPTTTINNDNTTQNTTLPTTTLPTTNKPENQNVSADWKKYSFSINGKNLTLPLAYNSFATATGFNMKSSVDTEMLKNNYYALVNVYKNDKFAASIEIFNKTGSEIKPSAGSVTRVSQMELQVKSGDIEKIVFPGNLTVGMSITKEQIVALFGEPTKIDNYKSGDYNKDTYSYNADTTWTTTNYYKIEVLNGVIDTLTLDHRN